MKIWKWLRGNQSVHANDFLATYPSPPPPIDEPGFREFVEKGGIESDWARDIPDIFKEPMPKFPRIFLPDSD